jgi:hypothetical protein
MLTRSGERKPVGGDDMVRITVTPEQVWAARIEVQAFRSAGLEPDPLVVRMAQATARGRGDGAQPGPPSDRPTG